MTIVNDAGVVVTGGGGGIGRAIARRLAADGAKVVVNDLDPAAAHAVGAEVWGPGGPRGRRDRAGRRRARQGCGRVPRRGRRLLLERGDGGGYRAGDDG